VEWFEIELDEQTLKDYPPDAQLCRLAELHGTDPETMMKRLLCENLTLPLEDRGDTAHKFHIAGHVGGLSPGPEPSSVMIIGRQAGEEEERAGKFFAGPCGTELRKGINHDLSGLYLTNVLKFRLPMGMKRIPADYLKFETPLLMQELALVQPMFIFLLGADAIKALLGKKATLTRYRSAVLDWHGAKVVCSVNPAQILYDPSLAAGFYQDARMFV